MAIGGALDLGVGSINACEGSISFYDGVFCVVEVFLGKNQCNHDIVIVLSHMYKDLAPVHILKIVELWLYESLLLLKTMRSSNPISLFVF